MLHVEYLSSSSVNVFLERKRVRRQMEASCVRHIMIKRVDTGGILS